MKLFAFCTIVICLTVHVANSPHSSVRHRMKLFAVCAIVICVAVHIPPSGSENHTTGFMILHEGNSATQNIVCILRWGTTDVTWNFKKYGPCENDETRSATLEYAKRGTTITLYDSPSGSKDDDYTVIKVIKDVVDRIVIPTYEKSFKSEFLDVTYHRDNGLDGKVSRFEIFIF